MFCPECGNSNSGMIEGLCRECFLKQFSILKIPENIEVTVCAHCNAKFEEGKWKESNILEEEIIYRALEKAIEIDSLIEKEEIELKILQMRGTIAECYIEAVAIVFGKEIHQTYEANVRLKKTVCPDCSKRNSGYYEAVIQFRSDKRELANEEITQADKIVKKSLRSQFKRNKLAYLAEKAIMKEGIDYYIGSYKAAKKIASDLKNRFGGVIKESPRLISQDKSTGKGLYRIWISVRLPNFKTIDVIKYLNKIGQIIAIDGNKIVANDLNTFDNFSISWKEYNSIEVVKTGKEIKTSNIISKSPSKIQILNPDNYEVVDIDIHKVFKEYEIGDEVNVVKIDENFYIVPEIENNKK
ncbi:MAG: NMD3-related protein [Methanobrevibacter sp.]|nr:NMD3-related protein [Methanobrevibacter sp.]